MTRGMFCALGVVVSCVLGQSQTAIATIRYVKPGASGSGASWSDASGDLQAMITASSSLGTDEVWVAAGNYKPGTTTSSTFSLKSGVAVYGGFDGTESNREDRDWVVNETILSGDIGTVGVATDNCFHVVTANAVSASPETRLDGFTLRDGFGSGSGSGTNILGAGIFVSGSLSSPQVVNCTIRNNLATASSSGQGGGVAVDSLNGQPIFQNCLFLDNRSQIRGGGLYAEDAQLLIIRNCRFEGNETTGTATLFPGGGAVALSGRCGGGR